MSDFFFAKMKGDVLTSVSNGRLMLYLMNYL